MTRPREQLIRELAAELEPRRSVAPARGAALAWLAAAFALVAAATLATGDLRPGVARQLSSEAGFAVDLLLGGLAAVFAALGWVRLRVPGSARGIRAAAPALLSFGGWIAWQGFEFALNGETAAKRGMRDGCSLEVVVFALAPLAIALWVARRAAPLERAWTGLLAGIAAGALGALAMQVACAESPLHALAMHIAPVCVVSSAGALLGRLVLRPL